jgi:hypothetical protein
VPPISLISPETAAFFGSGISVMVGSRDARNVPDCVRALGARVEDGGQALTVFLPQATSARTAANLADNRRIAVMFSRMSDHHSLQVKGEVVSVAPGTEQDRATVDAYRQAWGQELVVIGVPLRDTLRMAHWPCWAVRLRPDGLFVQTPGPGAGAPLHASGAQR